MINFFYYGSFFSKIQSFVVLIDEFKKIYLIVTLKKYIGLLQCLLQLKHKKIFVKNMAHLYKYSLSFI